MNRKILGLAVVLVVASIVVTVAIASRPSQMNYLKAQQAAVEYELRCYRNLKSQGTTGFWYSAPAKWTYKIIGWGVLVPVYRPEIRRWIDVNERIAYWTNRYRELSTQIAVLEQLAPLNWFYFWQLY